VVGGEIATEAGAEVGTKVAAEVGTKAAGEVAEKAAADVAEKTAASTGAAAGRGASFAEGASGSGERSLGQKILEQGRHNPIKQMVTSGRTKAAQAFLDAGEATPLRQGIAGAIQGSSGTMPEQLEGMSDAAYKVQKGAWAARQANNRFQQVRTAGQVVEDVAHPVKALERHAASGSGQSQVSQPAQQPGTEIEPYKQPGAMQPVARPGALSQPVNNSYSPGRGFAQPQAGGGGSFAGGGGGFGGLPPTTPAGASAASSYPGMPTSPNTAAASAPSTTSSPTQSAAYRAGRGFGQSPTAMKFGKALTAPRVIKTGGQHFWQGSNREAFSGINPGYDWRKGYTFRPAEANGKIRLRQMGAPEEAKQPGAYDVKSGQQPEGALNPGAPKMTTVGELGTGVRGELGAGPDVHFGAPGPFKMAAPMAVGQGTRQQSFYAGSGEYNPQKGNTGIIDADSHSPDDYKFEPGSNQGYLDFPDMPRSPLTQPKSKSNTGLYDMSLNQRAKQNAFNDAYAKKNPGAPGSWIN
jgi:hypothetical protein